MQVLHRDVFTVGDVMKLCGLTQRQADDWYSAGIIRASIQAGNRGKLRLFAFTDLFGAYLAASLRRGGMSLEIVRKATAAYYATPWDGERYILTIADDDVTITTIRETNRMIARGVPVSHVNLLAGAQQLRDEIERQLAEADNADCN